MANLYLVNQLADGELVTVFQLAQLIGKKETTIRTCASSGDPQRRSLIPKWTKIGNDRRLFFRKEDILAWVGQITSSPPKLGRPRKSAGSK